MKILLQKKKYNKLSTPDRMNERFAAHKLTHPLIINYNNFAALHNQRDINAFCVITFTHTLLKQQQEAEAESVVNNFNNNVVSDEIIRTFR